jgi:hypothetical protein
LKDGSFLDSSVHAVKESRFLIPCV